MKEYNLYVDESGNFKKTRSLVGGFLVESSNKHVFTENVAEQWCKSIRQTVIEKNICTADELNSGDEIAVLGEKDKEEKKKELKSENKQWYVFDHCSENGTQAKRWDRQSFILKEYIGKLKSNNASIVIFDNPSGEYNSDSTTTYLSVLALGFMQLYASLKAKDPNEEVYLYLHIASRKDTTLANDKDSKTKELNEINDSPTYDERKIDLSTISINQYKNQLRNCIYLQGGIKLLKIPAFEDSLNKLDLINDIKINGAFYSNPITIICDYICNSYYVKDNHPNIKDCFKKFSDKYIIKSFDDNILRVDSSIEYIKTFYRWKDGLDELISRGFPAKETDEFFKSFNNENKINKYECIDSVCDTIRTFVENRENMKEMAQRLEEAKKNNKMNGEWKSYWAANLDLFLISLYTHMGDLKKTKAREEEFKKDIVEIPDTDKQIYLITIYCNRMIVTCQDSFQYSDGVDYFGFLEKYYTQTQKARDNLLLSFLDKANIEVLPPITSVEYGKAVGSYMQLLRHYMHNTRGKEERESLIKTVRDLIPNAPGYFTRSFDISRCYQNICDIYVELCEFDKAIEALYHSINSDESNQQLSEDDMIDYILNYTGVYGDPNNIKYMYLYMHLTQIMHESIIDAEAEKQNECIGYKIAEKIFNGESINDNTLNGYFTDNYPNMSIIWHLCASLSRIKSINDQQKGYLKEYLTKAYSQMYSGEYIFKTIGCSIHAEMIKLISDGLLLDSSGIDHMKEKLKVKINDINKGGFSIFSFVSESDELNDSLIRQIYTSLVY